MSNSSSKPGRWIAACLALAALVAIFTNVVIDNMPKGEVRKIEAYNPWSAETLKIAETIPVQDGGRIKPFVTYAGFTMLSLHGARSMKVEGVGGKTFSIKPTAWLMDTLFRPQFSVNLPTFIVENSAVLEAIGVKPRGKRDRYSYADLEPGRVKLVELAQSYEAIKKSKREAGQSETLDPVQTQTIDLAYKMRTYESLLGYFGFARFGVTLHGSGKDGAPDQRADISAVMATAPQIRAQVSQSQAEGQPMDTHLQSLLEQVFDAANFAKFGLFILPPSDAKDRTWLSAGNAIMIPISGAKTDPELALSDVKMLETTARLGGDDGDAFRKELTGLRDNLAKRAQTRGEYRHVPLEANYYQINWFLYAMAFFIVGIKATLAMWTARDNKLGQLFYWATLATTFAGFVCCVIPIVKRSIIMQRPPVGNLYDTIIFIATAVVLFALLVEWMTRRGLALGVAPLLGAMLIILARRFELGDAKDNMDPLVAVLNSNYWLTIHVITITLGYAAGLLSAFMSVIYLLVRGLRLVADDRDIRRFFTRAVYGMICLTLFLSLVGTVLGGVWANDSWGRFWGWDPKENGALMIVLWTLAILHARLGGYIKEWGLHLASVFTAAVVTFSWWHVNFLGVGLHNYGFTAGKDSIYTFYKLTAAILALGFLAKFMEGREKASRSNPKEKERAPLPVA